MRRSESEVSDRRRKISYAIQEPSSRRKHRLPQVVGLMFFLVLASVITVGLVFGIGPSDDVSKNSTIASRVMVSNDLVQGPNVEESRLRELELDGRTARPPNRSPANIDPDPTQSPSSSRDGETEIEQQNGQTTKTQGTEEEIEEIKIKETCDGKLAEYRFGTVNSNSKSCSEVGVKIMARHGSAVDAALATMVCLGVVNPHASGIGGGFFMLVYKKETKEVQTLDARVSAPARSTRYMFEKKLDSARRGYLSVATPGSVQGLWEAHQKFGSVPWSDIFTPSIKLANDGFNVTKQLHNAIKTNRYKVQRDSYLKHRFIDSKTGDALKVGEKIDNAPLGRTLKLLAEKGPDEFYNGTITRDIILDLVSAGGSLGMDDLLNYRAKWRTPVSTTLKDSLNLYSMPAPGSGPLLGLMANIADSFYKNNQSLEDTSLAYHRIIEATKFAMARKLYLGDPDFSTQDKFIKDLETKEYAENLRNKITNLTHDDPLFYGNEPSVSDQGTGLVIVKAPTGDVVISTTSIGAAFGSGILGKYTGIIYNDGMADFDLPQTPPTFSIIPPDSNYIQPAKRPLSSMSPCLVVDSEGDLVLAMAAGGGKSGLTAQILTLFRIVYQNLDLKTAIDSPYLHNDWLPSYTRYERTLEEAVVRRLRNRGHVMTRSQSAAFINAVRKTQDMVESYVDPRKGGCSDGY